MTVESLRKAGIVTIFEAPASVGDTEALDAGKFNGELFPHLQGGIPAAGGVVLEEYSVNRAEDGTFLSIEGI